MQVIIQHPNTEGQTVECPEDNLDTLLDQIKREHEEKGATEDLLVTIVHNFGVYELI